MRSSIRIVLVTIFALLATGLQAKDGKERIYAFAVGTSFNDSTAYISSIMEIPDATTEKKTHFLSNRQEYSRQFKSFLDGCYRKPHTCAVFFSTKKSALEKKYLKLRNRYRNLKEYRLTELPAGDFSFRAAEACQE